MKKFLLTVIALTLIGCSNPKSTQIPTDPDKWEELKPAVDKLNEEDKKLLTQYLVRKGMGTAFGGAGVEPGTTIDEAIKDQQKWLEDKAATEKAQEELKAKIEAENAAVKKQMNEILTTAIISKEGYSRYDYINKVTNIGFKLAFENHSAKDISGFKGVVIFKDMFGDNIKEINLSYDDGVKANSTSTYEGSIDYNEFMADDVKLLNTSLDKIKFNFFPSVILFKDGSKIELKQTNES
ncbi:hypothetical protein NRA21_04550 [Acinetobacter baumannii]|nr:hypothetical protein [Acinetobacter baumannii]